MALTLVALVVATACGGGSDATLRITLEVDTTVLPPGQDISEVLDAVKDVVERRLDNIGASRTVTVEGENRLIVETSGITAGEAEDLIGRFGLLRFMEAEEDENGLIICRTAKGERFTAEYPAQVAAGVCTTPESTGAVVWKAAAGIRNDEVRELTGHQVKIGSAQVDFDEGNGQPLVSIEFTGEGALLFEQITTRLSFPPRPLGIFLDDDLIASPQVSFTIASNETAFTIRSLGEANFLANLLNTGSLPAPIEVVSIEEISAGTTPGTT